ncbi:MAG: carbon-nitrogen hydrolase family protein, partial [Gammaproteobacteria bacterium]|nr:carbon-nitrogen hydrolase family protein [Gammaproteobacteria bacterium]
MNKTTLKVGIAQIAPVWLDRDATVTRVIEWMRKAASQGCELVVFGEALIPGYPFWVERTDGARFESDLQKELYRHYVEQSVCIEAGDLDAIREVAKNNSLAVYVGVMERAPDRGGHSLYASMV